MPIHALQHVYQKAVALLGRINVVDLHQILNIDLCHVESKVEELLKHDDNLVLIQGDLIEM